MTSTIAVNFFPEYESEMEDFLCNLSNEYFH